MNHPNPVELGQAVGHHARELVLDDAAQIGEVLGQRLMASHPYAVLHNVGGLASRKLLHVLAAACGCAVEHLIVRRAGQRAPLAMVQFLDCPASNGDVVRVFDTDAETDLLTRSAVIPALLNRAHLVIALVADLPTDALQHALHPLREWIYSPDNACRHVEFAALTPALHTRLAGMVEGLSSGTGMTARCVPLSVQRVQARQAWNFLCEAWNHPARPLNPLHPVQSLEPLAVLPDPKAPLPGGGVGTAAHRPEALISDIHPTTSPQDEVLVYLEAILHLPGVHHVCLFHLATSRVIAASGTYELAQALARRGSLLLTSAAISRKALNLKDEAREMTIVGGLEAQGLHLLDSQPGWALHVLYSAQDTDWAALRPRLLALDAALPRQVDPLPTTAPTPPAPTAG